MSQTIHVFDYLAQPKKNPPAAVTVLFGDASFLKLLALQQMRQDVLGGSDDVSYTTFEGPSAQWRDVMDELATVSLFGGGGRRLAMVQDADLFVTEHRAKLENYVTHPRSTGVLVLSVTTWAASTRLYKSLDQSGRQIACQPPQTVSGRSKRIDESRIVKWLVWRAKSAHQVALTTNAAKALLELVGIEFGLLDQDLAKLALFVKPQESISVEMVHEVVGGWRAKSVWEMVDMAAEGNAAEALKHLDWMLRAGEHPLAVLARISVTLRRFATATRIVERAERQGRRITLSQAVSQAGFPRWPAALRKAEQQMKQLGRRRAGQMHKWLLEADLALKGTHSSDVRARWVLEQLILKMSRNMKG